MRSTRKQIRDRINIELSLRGLIPTQISNSRACEIIGIARGSSSARALRRWVESGCVVNLDHLPEPTPIKKHNKKKVRVARVKVHDSFVNSDAFLNSYEWRRVRMTALKKYGARCQCCGASPNDGVRMHVDHIKPRRIYPQLALDVGNLQVLCEICNHGKGNWDVTDWRAQDDKLDMEQAAHIRAILDE